MEATRAWICAACLELQTVASAECVNQTPECVFVTLGTLERRANIQSVEETDGTKEDSVSAPWDGRGPTVTSAVFLQTLLETLIYACHATKEFVEYRENTFSITLQQSMCLIG